MGNPIAISLLILSCTLSNTFATPPREFYEDQIAEESMNYDEYYPSFALPKIFNDGKPFIVSKDPVTGTIDFNTKKTIASSTPTNFKEVEVNKKQSADINQIAPNIHDFLNLPVKYSSAKSVYPLISSSYSNLKYQGNNKHFVSNHKNYTTSTTAAPKYYTNIVRATSVKNPDPTTSAKTSTIKTTDATKYTRPATTPATQPSTTARPVSTTTRAPEITTFRYDTKYKYQDSAAIRKKLNITTTPKPTKHSFPIGSKLSVIPLSSSTTTTKKSPPTYQTKPQYTPTVPTTSKTTSMRTTVIANVESDKDTTFVRFPSDKTSGASRPFETRPTETTTKSTKGVISTASSTPRAPTTTTARVKTTKKVSSLSDLFSLWSDSDDYYDENKEDNTVLPDLSLSYKDVPVSMLPSNYSEAMNATTSTPSVQTTLALTTTTTTTTTTAAPSTKVKFTETPTVSSSNQPSTTNNPHQTLAPQLSSQQNVVDRQNTPNPSQSPVKLEDSSDASSFFRPQVDLPMYQDPEHKVIKRPGTQEMLKVDLPELLPQLPTVASRPVTGPVAGFQGFHEAQQQQQQTFQPVVQDLFQSNRPNQQQSFFPPPQLRPQPLPHHQQNYVNYGGIGGAPIKNTFVISPSQDSASFVLGSQSMVGGSGDEAQSQNSAGHFVGSAIEEPLFDGKVPGKVHNDVRPINNVPQGFSLRVQPQDTNRPVIRFPGSVPDEVTNEIGPFEGAQIVRGTINPNPRDQIADESISSPLNQPNQVNFPSTDVKMTPQQMNQELSKGSSDQRQPGQITFREEVRPEAIKPPSQALTPPGDGFYEAPQFFDRPGPNQPFIYGRPSPPAGHQRPNQRHDQRPPPGHFHRLPLNERPHGNKLMNSRPQYRIDHIPMPTKTHRHQDRLMINERPEANQPMPDRNLPNILPQFRPNVKLNPKPNDYKRQPTPHRPDQYRPDGLKSHPPQPQPNLRRPAPSFVMRRPNQGPNQFISRISGPYYEEQNHNRRHYNAGPPMQLERLPIPQHMTPPQRFLDPKHPVFQRHLKVNANPLMMAPLPVEPGHPLREQDLLNRNEQNVQHIREELNQRNQQYPEPQEPSREPPKLEPVVTLHQLQAKKLLLKEMEKNVELPKLKETVPEVPVTLETDNQNHKNVYVVYPLKGQGNDDDDDFNRESKIVIASRGEHGSKVTPISTGSEYQNTPFSVVAHFEQEPLLPEKTKPIKSQHFPYSLEKPEIVNHNNHKSSDSDTTIIGQTIYNTGEQPGQVISSTLTRVTTPGAPIAIAYTPTPRPLNHKGPIIYDANHHEVYSLPNIGTQVISEIRDGPQTETSNFYNDYDVNSDRVKENFQAPFYASANLPNKVTAANVFEGWAIATPPPPPMFQVHYDNNHIDRADTGVTDPVTVAPTVVEVTTKKFDPNSFKPEFLSGFQPILSTQTVKVPTASEKLEPAPRDGNKFELSTEHLLLGDTSSSTSGSTGSSTTVKQDGPTTKKETKKPFRPFDSLEAFFDALTRGHTDPDPDYDQSTSKSS